MQSQKSGVAGVRDDLYLVWFGRLLCSGVGVAGVRDDIYLVWLGRRLCSARRVGVAGVRGCMTRSKGSYKQFEDY